MNLTDFRDQLAARAAEGDRPEADPLPVLRGRIRAARRRRVATATAGAAVGVALVATVIPAGINRLGGAEQTPATPGQARPADVVKGGIRFPGAIGADTLLTARIGEVGQEQFSFEVTAPAGETEIRPVCELPGTTANTLRSTYWVQVFVNGRMLVTSACGEGEGAKAGEQEWNYTVTSDTPGVNLQGMEAGRRARITVRFGLGDPEATRAPNSRARMGVGIYRLGPRRVVERAGEGTRIPELVDHQGHTYRLADVRSRTATEGAALTVNTPADTPFLVRYLTITTGGTPGVPKSTLRTLRLTGLGAPISASARYHPDAWSPREMPSFDPVRVEARPAGTATVTLDGATLPHAKLMLAVYRQER
jgi:hypothetical protein